MKIISFRAEHLEDIKLQGAQTYLSDWVTRDQGLALEALQSSTAVEDDGTIIAAAGLVPQWKNRAVAWAFLSDTGPHNFMKVHRLVMKAMDESGFKRIELTADCDHPNAHRWAKLMGFRLEADRMEAYLPDGRSCSLYARVR